MGNHDRGGSKLEGYAARFALVIHFTRWAADDPELQTSDAVDRASIESGIRLSRWFGQEARRVYAILSESDEGRELRRLVELIRGKGGSVTPRDLMRSSRQWPTAADAEATLEELAKGRHGQWVEQPPSSKGDRPTRVFVLADTVDADTTPLNPGENGSSVNVNAASDSESASDDWGQL